MVEVFQRFNDKKKQVYEEARASINAVKDKIFEKSIRRKQEDADRKAKAERMSALISDSRYPEYRQTLVDLRNEMVKRWANSPLDDYSKAILLIDNLLEMPERVLKQLESIKDENRAG